MLVVWVSRLFRWLYEESGCVGIEFWLTENGLGRSYCKHKHKREVPSTDEAEGREEQGAVISLRPIQEKALQIILSVELHDCKAIDDGYKME